MPKRLNYTFDVIKFPSLENSSKFSEIASVELACFSHDLIVIQCSFQWFSANFRFGINVKSTMESLNNRKECCYNFVLKSFCL